MQIECKLAHIQMTPPGAHPPIPPIRLSGKETEGKLRNNSSSLFGCDGSVPLAYTNDRFPSVPKFENYGFYRCSSKLVTKRDGSPPSPFPPNGHLATLTPVPILGIAPRRLQTRRKKHPQHCTAVFRLLGNRAESEDGVNGGYPCARWCKSD